jgi:hypothetical protein
MQDGLKARLAGGIGSEHSTFCAENVWMDLKVISIGNPSILASHAFQWVIGPETQVHVLV